MSKVLTTEQAAELLGFGVKTVQKLAREQKISAHKHFGQWWIDREKLEMLLLGGYDKTALQAVGTEKEEEKIKCQSNNAVKSGGLTSMRRTGKEYARVVELKTAKKRKNTTTA